MVVLEYVDEEREISTEIIFAFESQNKVHCAHSQPQIDNKTADRVTNTNTNRNGAYNWIEMSLRKDSTLLPMRVKNIRATKNNEQNYSTIQVTDWYLTITSLLVFSFSQISKRRAIAAKRKMALTIMSLKYD